MSSNLERSHSQLLQSLRFILAFYDPVNDTCLDTNAWKAAEAGARATVKEAERLDTDAYFSKEQVSMNAVTECMMRISRMPNIDGATMNRIMTELHAVQREFLKG